LVRGLLIRHGQVVKSYLLNYTFMNSDFTVNLKTSDVAVHSIDYDQDWQVTLAFTGESLLRVCGDNK